MLDKNLFNSMPEEIHDPDYDGMLNRSHRTVTNKIKELSKMESTHSQDGIQEGGTPVISATIQETIVYQAALRRGTRDRHGYFLKKVSGYSLEGIDSQGWATICTRSGSCHEVDNSAIRLHAVKS
ncbi:MAG: hypothetical protein VKJ24_05935 [Synechococcales bacterium]|nr:hypothetical protein [Synechococcales bacterium]